MKKFKLKLMLALSFVMGLIICVPVCAAEADAVTTDTEVVAEDSSDEAAVAEADSQEEAVVLAATTNGWVENSDGTWSYYQNGTMAKSKVLKIGNYYYGFDSNGKMYEDTTFYMTNLYIGRYAQHRAKADGSLYVNTWYEDDYGNWYYYGEAGGGLNGLQVIGGITYYFNHGYMFSERTVYYNGNYYYAKKSGAIVSLNKQGWTQIEDNWVFCVDGEPISDELWKIGNYYYGFDYYGNLIKDQFVSFQDNTTGYRYVYMATSDGSMYTKGWYQDEYGYWYFFYSDGKAATGLVNLGGSTYYFNVSTYDPYMHTETFLTTGGVKYYVSKSGVVIKLIDNAWNLLDGKWYYMKNGSKLMNGIYEVDGEQYRFDHSGAIYTNYYFSLTTSGTTYYYYADDSGKLARNEWVYRNDGWYYFDDNCHAVNGVQTINGKTYYFYSRQMQTDEMCSYNGAYRLFDMNGVMVEGKTGWYLQNGEWYYFKESGKLYNGMLTLGGNQFYLNPRLYQNGDYLIYSDKLYLAQDKTGALTPITKDGWYEDGSYTYYVKNGQPLYKGWVTSGSSKYYISNYRMVINTTHCYIDGKYYAFDSTGKMYTNTWLNSGTTYVYATSTGALATGKQTIGGVAYEFETSGYLKEGYSYSGTKLTVYTDNGTKSYTLKEGWNEIEESWYYVFNGSIVRSQSLTIGGFSYSFDSDGKMRRDVIYNDCYFDKNGAMKQSAWIPYGKDWMYAFEDGELAYYGIYEIDGKEYYFYDYCMSTYAKMYGGSILTFNSDGSIKERKALNPNGWNYIDCVPVYYQNGSSYTGWLGNSYLRYGEKIYNGIIYDYDEGAHYCIDRGSCVYNKWCNENYSYAKADGKLAYDEWICLNGTWFYLDGYYYVTGLQEIDGVTYYFDDYGRLVKTFTTIADGWQQLGNDWYYGRDGVFVRDEYVYINGIWYFFYSDGAMANEVNYTADGREASMGWHYYKPATTGEAAEYYAGISGWVYVNIEGDTVSGWQKIDGVTYYFEYPYMVTGTHRLNDELHRFADSGAYIGEVTTKNGWYYDGKDYFYFKDGKVVYDQVLVIDGYKYSFDYVNGTMMKNEIAYDDTVGGYCFFGSSGAQVTTPGFYTDKYGDSFYVGKDGLVYAGYVYVSGQMVGTTLGSNYYY
ncbi:MAG: hypothetical protein E7258_00070 [Lachnospiraceae bacterium]|nr:hypothetical protein [Lachnospiraceae bacterium]